MDRVPIRFLVAASRLVLGPFEKILVVDTFYFTLARASRVPLFTVSSYEGMLKHYFIFKNPLILFSYL